LALCVALVNAANGVTALYIILTTVAFAVFLLFVVRPAFIWVLRRTHSLQDGPTQGVMVLTVLLVSSITTRRVLSNAKDVGYHSISCTVSKRHGISQDLC
jgi:hypothetical protein